MLFLIWYVQELEISALSKESVTLIITGIPYFAILTVLLI